MEFAQQMQVQRSALDDIHALKALLGNVMLKSDIPVWLQTPNDILDGARPLDVFFMHGLDAVLPAIAVDQPSATLWR